MHIFLLGILFLYFYHLKEKYSCAAVFLKLCSFAFLLLYILQSLISLLFLSKMVGAGANRVMQEPQKGGGFAAHG